MDAKEVVKSLRDAIPAWQRDGLGIRGRPIAFYRESASIDWPSARIEQSPNDNTPVPDVPESQPSAGGTAAAVISPFKLLDATDYTNPSVPIYKVRVVVGTLSAPNFGWSDVPSNMNVDDDPPLEFTVAVSGYAYLHVSVTLAEGEAPVINDVVVAVGATMPTSTDEEGYHALGTYALDTDEETLTPISAGGDRGYLYAAGHYFWGTTVEA